MIMSRSAPIALCITAGLGLSGCGSVLGASTAPAPAVATPTTPTTPTPSGPAQPFAYTGAGVGYNTTSRLQTVGPPTGAGDIEVTITEPDSPTLTRIDQVTFNGNETIRVRIGSTGYDQTFATANAQGVANTAYFSTAAAADPRILGISRWTIDGPPSNRLRVFRLSEGADPGAGTINPLEFVRVAEIRYDNLTGSFFTFGQQTAPADMFRTGGLHYEGESVGQYINYDYPGGRDFVARVSLDVNFAQASNQLTGRTFAPRFNDSSFDGRPSSFFDVGFQATIAGSTFSGSAVGVDAYGPVSGTVNGAFYGVAPTPADEVAGVFAVGSPNGLSKIGGAFAAGR